MHLGSGQTENRSCLHTYIPISRAAPADARTLIRAEKLTAVGLTCCFERTWYLDTLFPEFPRFLLP